VRPRRLWLLLRGALPRRLFLLRPTDSTASTKCAPSPSISSRQPQPSGLKAKKAEPRRVESLLQQANSVLRDLANYEHPKLSALKVAGDPNAPLSLSGLTDAELAYLRRVMIKIGAATGIGHAHSSQFQNARLHVVDREFGTTR
jgi:hypothetical protein